MKFLDCCRKVIGLESTPGHGNREVSEFLGSVARDLGFHVEFQQENLNGLEQTNVLVRPSDSVPVDELLMQTHLDTVEPGNFGKWTKTQSNPFNATIYGDELFGLGVADTKLDFVCKLYAAKQYLDQPLNRPFVLVGTFGAQSGMAGAVKLMRRKLVNCKMALVGEPTDLELVHAGQGLAVVEISIPFSQEELDYRTEHDLMESSSTQSKMFSGKAAHSSRPQLGENAIVKMLDYLTQLPSGLALMDLDGGVNFNSVPDTAVLEIDLVAGFRDPIVPKISAVLKRAKQVESEFKAFSDDPLETPTMNIGMIRTFEDQIRVTGSCRMPHSVSDETYKAWMQKLGEACEVVGGVFRVRDYKPAFHVKKTSDFLKGAQSILQELSDEQTVPQVMSTASEASVFSRMGVECLVFGPGVSYGNSHAPNEKVLLSQLDKATEFYSKCIERFCK
ncbi:MAG: M20/M25/M40 family metallo-hydrolase [Bdellovibrionales bacterium]|nr:M20/M25/M40 family metallo-hydrolase [Bdellovibrionales bacterium]